MHQQPRKSSRDVEEQVFDIASDAAHLGCKQQYRHQLPEEHDGYHRGSFLGLEPLRGLLDRADGHKPLVALQQDQGPHRQDSERTYPAHETQEGRPAPQRKQVQDQRNLLHGRFQQPFLLLEMLLQAVRHEAGRVRRPVWGINRLNIRYITPSERSPIAGLRREDVRCRPCSLDDS